MFRVFRPILKNYKLFPGLFWTTITIVMLYEVSYLSTGKIVGWIINILETDKDIHKLYYRCGIFAIVGIIVVITENYQSHLRQKIYNKINDIKSQKYYALLFQKEYKQIVDKGTGKILTLFNNGITAEIELFSSFTNIILSVIIKGGILVIILSYMMPWILAIMSVASVAIYFIDRFFSKKSEYYQNLANELEEEVWKMSTKMVMESLLINVHNKQHIELEKYNHAIERKSNDNIKGLFLWNIPFSSFYMLFRFLSVGVYLRWGLMVIRWTGTVAMITITSFYMWEMRDPLNTLTREMASYTKNINKYERLQEFLNEPSTIVNGSDPYIYRDGEIVLRDVHFGYQEGKKLLQGLDLTFAGRRTTALVGHSGSGKSTLVKLLLRLYDVEKGSIEIDGQRLTGLEVSSLYQHVGYLPQEPAIFDGTIRENLLYGLPDAHGLDDTTLDELLWKSLKQARIQELVKWLEKGLDTELWEKGIKLSGGERQRLAIARIFVKNPEILILDEPTSALDSIAEHEISAALHDVMQDRTVIIIAHRLQTVMQADTIYVMDAGQVIESGTHTSLIAAGGSYSHLVDIQHGIIKE